MVKFLIMLILITAAASAQAKEHVTLGDCIAAIQIAQRHNDQWQASFSKKECAIIADKAMDVAVILANPDLSDEVKAKALRGLRRY